MRADILRTYKTVHTWTGIISGLALFIAFYAGALTMFKEPLNRWVTPPVDASQADYVAANILLTKTLEARKDAQTDFTLHLGDDNQLAHRIDWEIYGESKKWRATIGQEGLIISEQQDSDLAQFIDNIHRTAGLPIELETGTMVMALISAMYFVVLVSGVIILLPTLIKDFFALRVGPNLKRMWLDAHNVIGIVSLPFHVIMALSAVVFGLHDIIYQTQEQVVYGEQRFDEMWNASGPFSAAPNDLTSAPMLTVTELLHRVSQHTEDFKPHSIRFRGAGTGGAVAWISGEQSCCMQRSAEGSMVLVSAIDGRLLNGEYLPSHQSNWMATVSSLFSLHFGSYGGNTVRWGYFFLGLAGAFLFYSGNLLWIESRRKTKRGENTVSQTRSSHLMAAGTVGVCLGCIVGLSLTIVIAKSLHGHVESLNDWHRYAYYLGFAGCIIWAFIRGGPRAAVELLWVAVLVTISIPMASAIGWLVPSTGLWGSTGLETVSIDLVAFVGAVGFTILARVSKKRLKYGRTDSVWTGYPLP